MNKQPAAIAISLLTVPIYAIAADTPASPHALTGNITLISEYLCRGIAQTRGKPALQGGFDYTHGSGFYAGIWGSNITWIDDSIPGASAGIEVDVYGGYKRAISDDLGFDIGVLSYNYPGSNKTPGGIPRQDSVELYGALSWRWLSLRYSHSTTALFGLAESGTVNGTTRGSGYLELNASRDLGNGWGLNGHIGHQKIRGNRNASYTDYRIGITRDLGFATLSLAYSDTNARADCSKGDTYCFVHADDGRTYDAGQGRLLLGVNKTF